MREHEQRTTMNIDHVTIELRTREQVRIAMTEFPLLGSDEERVKAARRLLRHAGKEIGAKVRTVHVRHLGAVFGYVDREPSEDELAELTDLVEAVLRPEVPPDA
jgi:predicted Zn-dependent protease